MRRRGIPKRARGKLLSAFHGNECTRLSERQSCTMRKVAKRKPNPFSEKTERSSTRFTVTSLIRRALRKTVMDCSYL
ncbi:MAG TPA: hypothetical protein DCP92_01250 [Nitrospiraceae bacterium]|nr:hypothetical protein [Nitrospiraceae bacterium]